MGLSDAHQDIAKIVESVSILEEKLQNAFRLIDEQVESMKNAYKSELIRVKSELNAMVSRAIDETKAQAFSPHPELRSPLGKWVWMNANMGDLREMQLYEPVVDIENVEKKVMALIEVHLKRSDPTLPEISLGKRQKAANCKTCCEEFTAFDRDFQCAEACQCSFCITQAIISHPDAPNCAFCLQPYPEPKKSQISAAYMACHVCGVAVSPVDEVEKGLGCRPCQRCVTITEAPMWKPWAKMTGHCSDCKEQVIEVDEEIYPLTRSGDRACCSKARGKMQQLKCGHWVCGVHAECLKRCRVCMQQAQMTSYLYP